MSIGIDLGTGSPVYTPDPIKPGPTPEERAEREASSRYQDATLREAFTDGAQWANDEDVCHITIGDLVGVFIGLLLLVNVFAFGKGWQDGPDSEALYPNRQRIVSPGYFTYDYTDVLKCHSAHAKWAYVIPGYRCGCEFGKWMSE